MPKFRVRILRPTPEGPKPKTVEVDSLIFVTSRYPDGHELAGNLRDIWLAVPDEKGESNLSYPFWNIKIDLVEDSE